jgi:lysozyme family protein
MGPRVASTFLQRWLSALNMQGKLYPDLKPDAIGNLTIAALKRSRRSRQRWRSHAAKGAELQPGGSLS